MRYRIRRSTPVHGVGGPSTGLLDKFLGESSGAAQVALGVGILVVGGLLLFSSTSAGRVAGHGVMLAARKGARLIPVVGVAL